MTKDFSFCPACGETLLRVLGNATEDRYIVECPRHGYVETVFYHIGEELPDKLAYLDGSESAAEAAEGSDFESSGQETTRL